MKPMFTSRSVAAVFIVSGSLLTSSKSFAQALSGTYTISAASPTAGNNFNNFTDAVTQLSMFGITGPVVFNVDPAVYVTQVIIPEIGGASDINTIVFNGNGATLKNLSSNTNQRAVLKLNGADFVTINNFVINAGDTASAQYGYGIQLINNADHNIIRNCTVYAPVVYVASGVNDKYGGILINSSDTSMIANGNADCDDNLIENNTVSGGYYGISLVANGSVNMLYDNKIRNNNVLDFFNAGIYLDGNNNTLVDANDISRPNRATAAFFYGIQLNNTSYNCTVSNNKIHDPFGGTDAYVNSTGNGIYFLNVNATAEYPNFCYNNILYNFKSSSIVRGFWITNSPYNQFVYNTMSLDDAGYTGYASTTGFEIGTSTNLTIQNNVVSIKRVGATGASSVGINLTSPTGCVFSNNDIALAPGSSRYFGKYGNTNCTDVAQWTSNTGDNTSINADPVFVAPQVGDLTPTNGLLVSGTPTNIITDILGMGRNAVPTMGAFEINGTPLALKMSTLKAQLNAMNIAVLSWETYTEQNNAGFEIQRSTDAQNWNGIAFINSKSTTAATYSYNDALMTESKVYYRLKQTDLDGAYHFSNVVALSSISRGNTGIAIYPNPASDLLHLSILNSGSDLSKSDYSIFNFSGNVVKTAHLKNVESSIFIADLPSGIYLIRVNNSNETYYAKFTKQ